MNIFVSPGQAAHPSLFFQAGILRLYYGQGFAYPSPLIILRTSIMEMSVALLTSDLQPPDLPILSLVRS